MKEERGNPDSKPGSPHAREDDKPAAMTSWSVEQVASWVGELDMCEEYHQVSARQLLTKTLFHLTWLHHHLLPSPPVITSFLKVVVTA